MFADHISKQLRLIKTVVDGVPRPLNHEFDVPVSKADRVLDNINSADWI